VNKVRHKYVTNCVFSAENKKLCIITLYLMQDTQALLLDKNYIRNNEQMR
jgi:hypothetical protein